MKGEIRLRVTRGAGPGAARVRSDEHPRAARAGEEFVCSLDRKSIGTTERVGCRAIAPFDLEVTVEWRPVSHPVRGLVYALCL